MTVLQLMFKSSFGKSVAASTKRAFWHIGLPLYALTVFPILLTAIEKYLGLGNLVIASALISVAVGAVVLVKVVIESEVLAALLAFLATLFNVNRM